LNRDADLRFGLHVSFSRRLRSRLDEPAVFVGWRDRLHESNVFNLHF
jgi:hypothetical protein